MIWGFLFKIFLHFYHVLVPFPASPRAFPSSYLANFMFLLVFSLKINKNQTKTKQKIKIKTRWKWLYFNCSCQINVLMAPFHFLGSSMHTGDRTWQPLWRLSVLLSSLSCGTSHLCWWLRDFLQSIPNKGTWVNHCVALTASPAGA